jgi:hypothetical protein
LGGAFRVTREAPEGIGKNAGIVRYAKNACSR